MIGFIICDKNGNEVIGSNTYEENIKIDELQPNEELETKFKFSLPLRPSSYSVTVAVAQDYETLTLDWIDNALVFQVLPPNTNKKITALVDVSMEVEVLKLNQIN
jgi:lipopolysaccharide transport system ATP-binding protein